MPIDDDIFDVDLESDNGSDINDGPRDDWAAAIKNLGLAAAEKLKWFSMRVHKLPKRLWIGLDPYPWMSQLMETAGADLVLMGSDSDVLAKVHGFAIGSGYRPILLHVLEDGDLRKRLKLTRSHTYQKRGDLQFGTLLYHTQSVEKHYDAEKGESDVTTLSFENLGSGGKVVLGNVHVLDCDEQRDVLTQQHYWGTKMKENARFYVSSDFASMFAASLIAGVISTSCWSYFNYHSTLVESPWLSGFFRLLAAPTAYGYSAGTTRYLLFHCMGSPEQSPLLYFVAIAIFPILSFLFAS